MSRYLRRSEAAAYLTTVIGVPCAKNTLNKLAVVGGGPLFYRSGRIPLYKISDLDSWALNKVSERAYASTSDADADL